MVISPLTESHVITCHVCGIHYHASITTLTFEMEFNLEQTYFGTNPYLKALDQKNFNFFFRLFSVVKPVMS